MTEEEGKINATLLDGLCCLVALLVLILRTVSKFIRLQNRTLKHLNFSKALQ